MFKRYSWPAKRAIFFARSIAVLSEAPQISTMDLLRGLMWGDDSRAQTLFQLRERFPLYTGCPFEVPELPKKVEKEPGLDNDSMWVLRWACAEATRMGDYWIDTEHLLLGILRVKRCTAEWCLAKAGIQLRPARKLIRESRASRPDYGPVPRLWPVRSRIKTFISWGWP